MNGYLILSRPLEDVVAEAQWRGGPSVWTFTDGGFRGVNIGANTALSSGDPYNPVPSFGGYTGARFTILTRIEEASALQSGEIDALWTTDKSRVEALISNPLLALERENVYVAIGGNIQPYEGQDIDASGGGGVTEISGTAADDVIASPVETSSIDGSVGTDTVTYSGQRVEYDIDLRSDGSIVVTKPGGTTDTLINIERLAFAFDGTLAFDVEAGDAAGTAYRIYKAAFDRTPDTAGLTYWVDAIDEGMPLLDVAAGFIASLEFVFAYGDNPSNRIFVEKLYQNVLGRDGEAAGIAYWEQQLADGASRAQVLASFSESPENISGVAPAIADGIWYA